MVFRKRPTFSVGGIEDQDLPGRREVREGEQGRMIAPLEERLDLTSDQLRAIFARPVAYHKLLAIAGGSVGAGVFLSQLVTGQIKVMILMSGFTKRWRIGGWRRLSEGMN
jgi:hypothetical protein